MEWWLTLPIIFGGLVVLMLTGLPIAFCFLIINLVGVYFFWGGQAGLAQLTYSIASTITNIALLPLLLFTVMGEVMFQSGMAPLMIDALDRWLGRMPGRLGLLAVSGGTILATLTGASTGSIAVLGTSLVPEMEKRGYKKSMSLGPILGSGGLAVMIPPSSIAVVLGAIGEISVGRILIAIIIPGLLMASLYAAYIVLRCWREPDLAPPYIVPPSPISDRLLATAKYILPLGFIIFAVTGVIFLGIATPTEAGATGALSTFILAAAYNRLNWNVVKKSIGSSVEITVMMLLIMAGAGAFGQVLAFSGASKELAHIVVSLPVPSIVIIILMQVVLLFLGCFMPVLPIMMITLPIFVPVVHTLGYNAVWFAAIYMLNMEMALTTPPFGLSLFVMKAVAPPDTTMKDVYLAGLPFIYLNLLAMILMLIFPAISLWLPGLMQ